MFAAEDAFEIHGVMLVRTLMVVMAKVQQVWLIREHAGGMQQQERLTLT